MAITKQHVGLALVAGEKVSKLRYVSRNFAVELNTAVIAIADGDHIARDDDFGLGNGRPNFQIPIKLTLEAELVRRVSRIDNSKSVVAIGGHSWVALQCSGAPSGRWAKPDALLKIICFRL